MAVSYLINKLQPLPFRTPVVVSLNPPFEPDPALIFARFSYDHPQFDLAALEARDKLGDIQGRRRTWFCGAWTGHGFHEDGLVSGLGVAASLGAMAPWATSDEALRTAAE